MINTNMRKWIDALRSGDFEQTEGCLCDGTKYCCLGVASELAAREGILTYTTLPTGSKRYANKGAFIPPAVSTWVGMCHSDETFLIEMNDVQKKTFSEIADYLEETYA